MRERQSLRNPQGRRRNTSTGSDRQSAHPISGSGCRNRPAELRKRCIASIPNDATSIAETGSLPVSRSVLALPNRISTTGCRRQIAAPPPDRTVRRLERIENPKPRPGSPEPVFRGGVRLRTRLGRDHGDRFARILPETPMSEKAVSQFSEKIGK